jgi:hypothetical protein
MYILFTHTHTHRSKVQVNLELLLWRSNQNLLGALVKVDWRWDW